ncbi:hypothetical protein DM860_004051 [Cuscuta australis]|uniref:Uncharacterized protein n=1 Tax=Cuscuta australis TaxID=267555 RepID=A0A328CYK4_9ASTE|nr:hypothetical protein DM860_004051 [Cuscuta australis]
MGSDLDSDSVPLLSSNNNPHLNHSTEKECPFKSKPSLNSTLIFTTLLVTTCITLSAAIAFAFLFFSPPSSSSAAAAEVSRPLTKLKRPVVLFISSDGFRFGYQYKTHTPNIDRLIKNGTEAELGLIPVFPTLTFPNHYSIVTGLYPAYHGIINNHFLDPDTGEAFTMQSHEPKWWLGEPLWETVVNHGLKASTYFWPGSEVHKGSWKCPELYCKRYNGSVEFEERVDTVLRYFDLPDQDIPSFMTLYFEDPDHQGHKVGPDDPQITEAVTRIDALMGRLIRGLEERGVFDDVTIIMVGDHGMVGTCDKKLVFLDDFAPWIEIPESWIQDYTPLLAISPPANYSARDIVSKMNEAVKSGEIDNAEHLKVYLKEDLPGRLHYSGSDRIPPVLGLLDEAYSLKRKNTGAKECGGAHGYDNGFFSMRTIFIAHGPRFARGRKVQSFENVQIYNLVTEILNLTGAPNNGTSSFPDEVLLPAQGSFGD